MYDGAPFRPAGPGGTDADMVARPWWWLRDPIEWLLAGVASVAVALVIALLVAPLVAQRGPSRGNLRASGSVGSPAGRSVASPNVVKAGAPAVGAGSPKVGAVSATAAAPVADRPTMLPDGSPLPVLVVFDGDTITLSGSVRSDAARQRLSALAKASSKTPNAKIVSSLTIDPRVPDSVGVRVIEMNAARFATGSINISEEQAPEFGRVAAVTKTLPNVTVLVVGHADQRGDSEANLKLSQARALAVVEYLIAQHISPDRLSARGVGDRSPLTQQSDAAGLALNRRTEFVFFGLLVGV